MPIKFTITDDDVRRSRLVKPGWYPTLISDVNLELSSKRDSNNVVLDGELADKTSEFYRVPFKHWLNEKGKNFPGGMVSFATAMMGGKMPDQKLTEVDFETAKGKFYYAKWGQVYQGKDGQQELPRNAILDWAPLPAKYADLASAQAVEASADVAGFES